MYSFIDAMNTYNKLNAEYSKPFELMEGAWCFDSNISGRIIVSSAPYKTLGEVHEVEWIHASVSRKNFLPDYADLVMLHRVVFRNNWAYQVFAPREKHVNIHKFALHLWGREDGKPQVPDFVGDSWGKTGIKSI